ncbi:MAG TPA: glycosyltransferase family 87 protein, partial [Pseudolabrys sp.]
FGMMIYKPHLALLLPVALIAGRQWRAIAAAAVTAGVLLGLSWLVFGPELWGHYLRILTAFRHVIVESNISPRVVSVFIAARSLGASVATAYWVQGAFGVIACCAVAAVWFKQAPAAVKNAVLLLGTCLVTPYVLDYDLVFGAIVVAWLWQQPVASERAERALQIGSGMLLVLPLVAAALAHLTGLAFGPLFILPLFVVALQMSFGAMPAAVTASSSSRLSSAQS